MFVVCMLNNIVLIVANNTYLKHLIQLVQTAVSINNVLIVVEHS